jgi:hypothetical protein
MNPEEVTTFVADNVEPLKGLRINWRLTPVGQIDLLATVAVGKALAQANASA